MLHSLLDWVYPPCCVACRTLIPLNEKEPRDMFLCNICQSLFDPIEGYICKICGVPTENDVQCCVSCYGKTFFFTSNRSTFLYDNLIKALLLELKFKQKNQIAHSLAKLWAKNLSEITFLPNSVFAPLPLHPKKEKERGFNQAKILAVALSRHTNIPLENALLRTIDTPPQSGLHPRERIENVSGAFKIAKGIITQGKNYIIIDDIYTTGASLNECAKVLKQAGAESVSCMTLAVVVKKSADLKSST